MNSIKASAFAIVMLATLTESLCPFGFGNGDQGRAETNYGSHDGFSPTLSIQTPPQPTPEYAKAVHDLDIDAVQADLLALMKDSKEEWPADYGNYGPLFVRLAWHCSGTFRDTDGRGGCSGGRQRFEPEASWEDNGNLDKARALLGPIKDKYGLGLSWGDLFVMAGTTAIESMGGPTLGICVGRVDDEDGSRSEGLTPGEEVDDECPEGNGNCGKPFGTTTSGLIYVNPEGPMGKPIPDQSAVQVRDTFDRMGMNDYETVALVGGGHSFGKAHGTLTSDGGKGGKGENTYTTGFEGPWTTNPTGWDNSYFQNLVNYEWEVHEVLSGHNQWRVKTGGNSSSPHAQKAHGKGTQDIMMLTSDIALLHDPESKYQNIVDEFATNPAKFDEAFAKAWHKLTTRAFGANKAPRCATKRWISEPSTTNTCRLPFSSSPNSKKSALRGSDSH